MRISEGNMKLGRIPNISLPPGLSCVKDAPCAKDCYARKAWRMYPNSREAWTENLYEWNNFPQRFEEHLKGYFKGKINLKYFRFHVSGDIPSQEYLDMMFRVCAEAPEVKFLAFTKNYHLDFTEKPENLSVVFSAWPGFTLHNPENFPVAWMQDGTEDRVPAEALECPGKCDTCGMCFLLQKGQSVVFHKH